MSVAKSVEAYIEGHPSVSDCIKMGVINYSGLSRLLISSLVLKDSDFDAVLVACRRYYLKSRSSEVLEAKIIDILSRSFVEVRNRIAVVVLDKGLYSERLIEFERSAKRAGDIFYAVEGSSAITVVISSSLLGRLKDGFRGSVRRSWDNLALVVVRSPEGKQDSTPGFMSFLTGRISRRGINILEFMSCWSETLLVIDEKDVAAVMAAFKV